MSDYIPPEFYQEILLRLPAKSICRFRTVSKLFNSIITSKTFIDNHIKYNLNSDSNNHLLLQVIGENQNDEEFMFLDYSQGALSLPATPILNRKVASHRIVGICQGLICVMYQYDHERYGIVLWNPSIRRYVGLPGLGMGFEFPGSFAIGFGSDALNDDYKIVIVVFHGKGEVSGGVEVDIFSLRTWRWRRVDGVDLKCFLPIADGSHACLNDRTHWIGWSKDDKPKSLIISFDMHNEVFKELSLPKDLDSELSFDMRVSVTRGCLTVITNASNLLLYSGVWVMKTYGDVKSWTLLYNVETLHMCVEVDWISKSGTILVRTSPTTWGVYDPENGRMTYLDFSGLGSLIYVDKYEESLVLLNLKSRPRLSDGDSVAA